MSYLKELPIESIFDSVFPFYGQFDSETVITALGGKIFEETDVAPELFLGQKFIDLPFWQSSFSNIENFQTSLQNVLNGKPSGQAILLVSNDDLNRFVELNLVPVKNSSGRTSEIFFCTNDITDLKKEKDFFKTRCDEYLFAAENAQVGLWFWNLSGDEIYSTPKSRELLDISSEHDEIPAEEFVRAIHPEDRKMIEEALSRSRKEGKEYAVDCRVIRSDGNIRWLNARGKTIFGDDGKPKTMTGSLREITDQKIASEELNIVLDREKNARAEAVDANRAKDNFLAVVSHELRSSLNSILGWTQILSSRKLNEFDQAKALKTIDRSARSQAKLIEDLVDSARIGSGKLKLELRPVKLAKILRQVITSLKPALDEKEIELYHRTNTYDVEVYGDYERLLQVFTNLLSNAVKFTDEHGKISIDLSIDSQRSVKISIEDNGRGIRREDLPSVFDQFEQAGGRNAGRLSGLGLGLSIAKILIEKHEGTITAESEGVGKGAKFTVVLPAISIQSIIDVSEENQKEKKSDRGILDGLSILIVEDDEDSREVLQLFLTELDADVTSCGSAKDAMEILEAGGDTLPDIIVSDLGMPEEDGYSFIKRVRKTPKLAGIPAVALSAFTALSNKLEAIDSGFHAYHTKPFDPDLLAQEILDQVKRNGDK
ncbi:MAG: response regulator [Acidobacteria bacterium]|nr:response regulator [Acidobacteriota bacterium]